MSDCKKCGIPLVVKPGMFHWRGRFFSGLVCEPCNALWDNPDDSFHAYVAQDQKEVKDG